MKKPTQTIFLLVSLSLLISGIAIISGLLNAPIAQIISQSLSRGISSNWQAPFRLSGIILILVGLFLTAITAFWIRLHSIFTTLHTWVTSNDQWLEQKLGDYTRTVATRKLEWPYYFTFFDWGVIVFFAFLALVYQLATSSHGFPTVILGGDAANIASFAAGRAFPDFFSGDAILGDLRNIGLYVTIHIPLTIWIEKILGNFGLAYSILLFPHVFMQYFSYYLLGRAIFNHRYWAFLFSLAVSAPLNLAGGEIWGVAGDGMPRFTYQVLIPFILIFLLSSWRESPKQWPWVMAIAGLMAFIHPVSTPTWAFALWLGLWPCMPPAYQIRQKFNTMIKMGVVLALALLPYASIYLYFHKGGSSNSNYDLVHFILQNYFPYELLDIPAAVRTLFTETSKFGLLGFGIFGLFSTLILFRSERGRITQMLYWILGISFVSIFVPFVEQIIERTFRIIPLQTELMRGMRYLIIFLFIFWYYPYAELTNRLIKPRVKQAILVIGTLITFYWLGMNTPYPLVEIPQVMQCWAQGNLICPTDTEYADVMVHVRTDTPKNAKFVVFLTNRWSGIEVRYLGLRPMAYAYKDRGQLAFTNLEALNTWYYFLQRENGIYSRNSSPTLDLQRKRMVDFAFDAEANYLLTDFPFPPEVCKELGIKSIYKNERFYIIKIYNMRQ